MQWRLVASTSGWPVRTKPPGGGRYASSTHNRGLHLAEFPENTSRPLAPYPDLVIEVSATGQKLTARLYWYETVNIYPGYVPCAK